jgi:phospholipid transport system substrate-binding protein
MNMRWWVSAILVLSLPSVAHAETPGRTLVGIFDEAERLLSDPETETRPLDRFIALEKLAGEAFDFRGAAELALGRRWMSLTDVEQDEFTLLFANLLGRSVLFRNVTKARFEGGGNVQFLSQSINGNEAVVRTSISRHDHGGSSVDYRMIEHDGRWKVRDMVVDGVSMTSNYRAQLDRVLETRSISEVLARMRARFGMPPPGPAATPAVASATAPTSDAKPEPPRAVTRDETPVAPVTSAAAAPLAAAPPSSAPPSPSIAPPPPSTVATSPAQAPQAPTPGVTEGVAGAARTTKAYWLQIGTFSSLEAAQRLAARIPRSQVVPGPTNATGVPLLRVRSGPFQDAADAISELLDLQKRGYNPFMVAERN